MNTHDIATLRTAIEALRREHPEVFDDEAFALDVLEGETDFLVVLQRLDDELADADALCDAIKARREALSERAARIAHRAEVVRSLMQSVMETAGLQKVPLPTATLSLRKTPPKVVVIDETEVPDAYWRVKREINKTTLAEALKAGEDVPGAALSNGGQTLARRV